VKPDLWAVDLYLPHILEWNFANSIVSQVVDRVGTIEEAVRKLSGRVASRDQLAMRRRRVAMRRS
jgi:hypothetical protein